VLTPERLAALPAILDSKLDTEQLNVLHAIGASDKLAFSIEAYAGTGKSQLLKALLW
jgi:hypothetical protein